MDADAMVRKNSYRETLQASQGRLNRYFIDANIAKGLHFPNVTLVGITMPTEPDLPDGRRATFQHYAWRAEPDEGSRGRSSVQPHRSSVHPVRPTSR
jgi:hypothetical protein